MTKDYKLLPLYPQGNAIYNNEAELLFQSFTDPKIKNIGIVAPYGAGKSSLIKTFRQNYDNQEYSAITPKLRFLDITLASFNDGLQNNSNKTQKDTSGDENFNNAIDIF